MGGLFELPDPCFALLDYLDRHSEGDRGVVLSSLPEALRSADLIIAATHERPNPGYLPPSELAMRGTSGAPPPATLACVEFGYEKPVTVFHWSRFAPWVLNPPSDKTIRVRLTADGRSELALWRVREGAAKPPPQADVQRPTARPFNIPQLAFGALLAFAVALFSVWSYFLGSSWWLSAVAAVAAYVTFLSGVFLGSSDAWLQRLTRSAFASVLSSPSRTTLSLFVVFATDVVLAVLAYRAVPADVDYFTIRVYDGMDVQQRFQVGARVTLLTDTDGCTHQETVSEAGAAKFRSLTPPTTYSYQLEVPRANPPFVTGDNGTLEKLPAVLGINVAAILPEKRLPLSPLVTKVPEKPPERPPEYLKDVAQKGVDQFQDLNAPWGVPAADLIVNRLGYILGFDTQRKMPRWVAYAVGPTDQRVPRDQMPFRIDPAIPANRQAALLDYRGSGFDRGHLVSPADMFFKGPIVAAEASFLSTVSPQTPWLNQKLWARLEGRVRDWVKASQKEAFVIAGPLFITPPDDPTFEFLMIGDSHVPVPTHFFRVVARRRPDGFPEAFSVVAPNSKGGSLELDEYVVPIREVERLGRLNLFPLLDVQQAEVFEAERGTLW